jgi:hypothetical protein
MGYYKTPKCFTIEVPSSGSRSVQRNVGPTRQFSYHVDLTEVIKILNIKIPKHKKLTIIKSQCCRLMLEVLRVSCSRYSSCLQLRDHAYKLLCRLHVEISSYWSLCGVPCWVVRYNDGTSVPKHVGVL